MAALRPRGLLLLALLGGALLSGCGDDEVLTTTRNLDRPGPLAMVCAGRVGEGQLATGLRPEACVPDDQGKSAGTLYGLVANSAKGEVALFRTVTGSEPLIDLEASNPGFGFIPVGELPTAIAASPDSCRAVTANSGSCDLTLLDVPGVLTVGAGENTGPASGVVSQIIPHTASGPLRARPQDLLIVPASAPELDEGQLCPRPGSYRAFVSFPTCNLVAEIDLQSGLLLQGAVIGPDGVRYTSEPKCPVECTLRGEGERVDSGPRDLGASDLVAEDAGGGEALPPDASGEAGPLDGGVADRGVEGDAPSPADASALHDSAPDAPAVKAGGVRPFGLAFSEQPARLYVTSAGAGFVTVLDLDASGQLAADRRIPLSGGPGSTRIRLSPPTRQLGQFLYLIAQDRTVRVISVDLEHECETNIDLSRVQDGGVPLERARCFPPGDPETPTGQLFERGLTFGSGVPQDVTFVHHQAADAGVSDPGEAAEATPLNGVFAVVVASDSKLYVIDVEDWNYISESSTTVPSLHLPHRYRNALQGTGKGQADASVPTISGAGTGGVPVIVSQTVPPGGPELLPGEGVFLQTLGEQVPQEWSLVYEDQLVSRWSGALGVSARGLTLSDLGVDYCRAGVLGRQEEQGRALRHGDIAVIVGCQEDSECGLGQECVMPMAEQADYGLCLDASRREELFRRCSSFLRGQREYLVRSATPTSLQLDLLPVDPQAVILQETQPPGGCRVNEDCDPYFLCAIEDDPAGGVQRRSLGAGQCFRPGCLTDADCTSGQCLTPLDGAPAICAAVPLPLENTNLACQTDDQCRAPGDLPASCSSDQDCGNARAECRAPSSGEPPRCVDKGLVCADAPGLRGRCVRPSPCFSELQRYDVVAGRSFLVRGYRRTVADPETGECREDPEQDPLLAERLPVGLPTYPAIVGPRCEAPVAPLELPRPNPCFERLEDQGYVGFIQRTAGSDGVTFTEQPPSTVLRWANPVFWTSLGLSHLTSLPAGVPDLEVAPMPQRGLTITLDLGTGYSRFVLAAASLASLPTNLQVAPDGNVYLVDTGDRSGTTGTFGQVLRFSQAEIKFDNFQVK